MGLMKITLRKYPKIVEAMKLRSEKYNQETKEIFEKADRGEVLVICPETSLGISRTEKSTDELQRVYDEGRRIGTEQMEKVRTFLS
jgi:predicted patatin/cPLA2 family phospholipase